MARPFKNGIDYFPFDVDLLNDRKLRKPKMKYGYLATMVYIALLVLIYKDKGYYLDYSKEVQDDVHLDILDFLQGKHQPEIETVGEVIQDLVACELFSRDRYSEAIITSYRLQCVYYKAVTERKRIEINWDIWLLDENEMRELGSSNSILSNYVNHIKNGVNRSNNKVNQSKSTQSKGKESKGKESKEKYIAPTGSSFFTDQEIISLFDEYLAIRKKNKQQNTERAIKILVNRLNQWPDPEKKQSLENAIVNTWKNVYPVNEDKQKSKKTKNDGGNPFEEFI